MSHDRRATAIPYRIGFIVKAVDGIRQSRHQFRCQRAGFGHAVEQGFLVEPAHFDQPFDRFAVPVQMKDAVFSPGDRDNAEIERRGGAAVRIDLGLAEGAAARQCAVVEIFELHGTLHLVDAVPGQEDNRNMRIDPLDLFDITAVTFRLRQKGNHLLLAITVLFIRHADCSRLF